MINSTYNPVCVGNYDKSNISVDWQSVQGTCPAGETINLDFTLADDMLIDGIQLLAKGSLFGDTVTLQVVCLTGRLANGVTICPPNTVLDQFGTNVGINDDYQEKLNVDSEYPAKLLAGLTIRTIYTSTGSSPVSVIVNIKANLVMV